MISKNYVWDYDKCLEETLLACGGQECVDRFKEVKSRIKKIESDDDQV
jgi:hypothetical protein